MQTSTHVQRRHDYRQNAPMQKYARRQANKGTGAERKHVRNK